MNKNKTDDAQIDYEMLAKANNTDSATIKEFVFALKDYSAKADQKHPEEHRSYVYALCEKRGESLVPFYIGEGKGARVWSHEFETSDQIKHLEKELANEGRLAELEERKLELTEKIQKIDEIRKRNGVVVKYIIKWGMTSREAFMAESALINLLHIGGLQFNCGNNKDKLTNIVQGHQSEAEKQTGSTRARTVEEFCEEFAKETRSFEELQEKKVKALLININAGYPECLHKADREKAIRDTACGNWTISIDRFTKLGIEYVFATVQARVVGIYKIKEVNGKKIHYSYESANKNSEYPHGDDTVSFRKDDYNLAKEVLSVANSKGKQPSELVLADMSSDYRKKHSEKDLKKSLNRKYMILEYLSEDDPHYHEYMDYLHRRIIHKNGENIYGSGNPIKYID